MKSRHRRRKLSSFIASLSVVAICVGAIVSPGVSTTEVDLNDGGVWVTNSRMRLVAHLNYPSRSLDSGLRAASDAFNVAQNGEEVFVNDVVSSSLSPVDVAHTTLGAPADFTGYSTVVNAQTIAVVDGGEGRVWVLPTDSYTGFNPDTLDPIVEDVPGAVVAVGVDGSVHVASAAAGTVTSIVPRGKTLDVSEATLKGVTKDDTLQVAAIGSQPVVLAKESATLHLPEGDSQALEGELTLQESGPESDVIILASAHELLSVPLEGGEPAVTNNKAPEGRPSRPAMHRGCAYGAWAGSGAFVRDCEGSEDDVVLVTESLQTAEQAVFRTNRDVIVLNDMNSGALWLPDEQMFMIDNWDQINSEVESEDTSDEDSVDDVEQTLLPERNEENTPPVAVDDEFGVRAGRSTILPVLQNDSDADGDYLTATPVTQPSLGTVSPARDGGALEIAVDAGQSGSSTFEYEVSDGRGGLARAVVSVNVHGDEINGPPAQLTELAVSLAGGKKTAVNALTSWYDPDGDPFYLESVAAPGGISARSHENGTLEIAEAGHGPGKDQIGLRVSDGRDAGEGSLSLTIKEGGNEPPLANADMVVVQADSSATVSPLDNDSDPDGDDLRLVQIDDSPKGITASMDSSTGTITVEGHEVGTSYLGYAITDGPNTANGVIRVDVIDASDSAPPSAEADLGVLPHGGETLIDLLANDSDPMGGVLTVQQIDVAPTAALTVALIDHQLVRVTAPRGLTGPETFSYTVSNGFESATSTVTVIPTEASSQNEPPELTDDTLVVRTGDVGSVAVLANDRSPAGLKMTVSDELQHEITEDLASVFISDNVIRVRGGTRGGSGRIVYTVQDSMGNVSSAVLQLTVVEPDPERNTAPRPRDVIARTNAGKSVDIPIPLNGIDPEGDSVYLVGQGSASQLGSVKMTGTTFTYTASAEAKGTDTFAYIVEDRLGKQASGTVRVGVAPRTGINQNPIAVHDIVQVRPDTKVSVAVLGNDIDPDGDDVHLDSDRIVPQSEGMDVTANSGRLILRTPKAEGSYLISYGIDDGAGGSAEGIVTVIVRADAPLIAPIARDDDVSTDEVRAATSNTINVSVLANDEDPDGDISDVEISSPDAEGSPAGDGTVDVDLKPENQILIYTVTDADGLEASAIIRVPGTELSRPETDEATLPIKVKAGEPKEIAINDHIVTRSDRSVRITSEDKVNAGVGFAGGQIVKDPLTLTYTASAEFSGLTSVSLEVTDGKDLNDPEGRTAVVTLPIQVEGAGNRPPEFNPTAVEVAAGESVSVDLRPMVSDPDDGDAEGARFALEGSGQGGVSASMSGSTLEVSVSADQDLGNAGSVRIGVDDGKGGTVRADVPIVVVSSSRPLIQTSEAQVTLDAGKSTSVDVSQYATNPFSDQGELTLVGQPQVGAGGSASASGTVVTVQADPGFNGAFTATYRLADATNDPSREVQGTIVATVRDKPGAPVNASVVSNGPGTAQVSWTSGPANGTPITNFTVTDQTQGDSTECGRVTTCLFSGRRNGIEHTFSVTATNEVGESDASNAATTMIDIEPEAPGAPTLTPGDGQVTVSWSPPHNEGSAIIDYTVNLSPGGPRTFAASGGGAQTQVISGLTNGVEYTATVQARNEKGSSLTSQFSVPSIPYGAPGPVGSVTAQYASLGTGTGQVATVNVSWSAPGNLNGRAIEYYTVTAGSVTKQVPASAGTSTSLEGVGFSASQVQFSVTATNDGAQAGSHTSPPMTTSTWVVGQPLAPTISSVTATGTNNQATINWSASPAGQGWNPGDLAYEWSAGGAWAPLSGNTVTSNGLTNGTASNVQIRAVGTKTGSTAYSASSNASSVTPFGPPVAPSISCSGADNAVNCSWSGGSGNGRGATFALSDGATGSVSASGSRAIGAGYSETKRLCVTVTQAESGRTAQNCSSGTSNPKPYSRLFSTYRSGETFTGDSGACQGVTCYKVGVELRDWPPGSTVTCLGDLNGVDATRSIRVDASGNQNYVGNWNWNGRDVPLGAAYGYSPWSGIFDRSGRPFSCWN